MHYLLKNKYPVETLEQLTKAAEYVEQHISKFDPVARTVMAVRMEKRASELGADIHQSWVANYARFPKAEATYSPHFADNMKLRKEACNGKMISINGSSVNAVEMLDAIEKTAANIPVHDMAGFLADFDKMAGLEMDYDTKLMDPIFTVCGSHIDHNYDMVKVANEITEADVIKASKNPVVMEKLACIMSDSALKAFGEDAGRFMKDVPFAKNIVLDTIRSSRS
jgi:hypothetical protein